MKWLFVGDTWEDTLHIHCSGLQAHRSFHVVTVILRRCLEMAGCIVVALEEEMYIHCPGLLGHRTHWWSWNWRNLEMAGNSVVAPGEETLHIHYSALLGHRALSFVKLYMEGGLKNDCLLVRLRKDLLCIFIVQVFCQKGSQAHTIPLLRRWFRIDH